MVVVVAAQVVREAVTLEAGVEAVMEVVAMAEPMVAMATTSALLSEDIAILVLKQAMRRGAWGVMQVLAIPIVLYC